eukprot:SAG22_NODE_8619_length_641_cov_0.760148_1_plen_166_part_01
MSQITRNYERLTTVLKKAPAERTLADCYVLDENWASSNPLLSRLSQDARMEICTNARMSEYMKGARVVQPAQPADKLCVIFSGSLSIYATSAKSGREKCVGTLTRGQTFGEIPMIKGENHPHAIAAITGAVIIWVPLEVFDRTVRPTYGKELLDRAQFFKSVAAFR